MNTVTYLAGGVLLGALVGAFTNQHFSLFTLSGAALGALLPDWCERPCLTDRVGPNTLTHSLLGLVSAGILLSPLLLTQHSRFFTAVLLGFATHLFLDAATPLESHRARQFARATASTLAARLVARGAAAQCHRPTWSAPSAHPRDPVCR